MLRQPPLYRPNCLILLSLGLLPILPIDGELGLIHRRKRLITKIIGQLRARDMSLLQSVKVLYRRAAYPVSCLGLWRVEELRQQRYIRSGDHPSSSNGGLVRIDELLEGSGDEAETRNISPVGLTADADY